MLANCLLAVTLLTLAQSALASPPGCMLGALTGYSNPADIKSVCQDKNLNSNIASACGSSGDDATAAMKALADVCSGVSVKIATDVSSISSMSASASGSSKSSATSMASGASMATAGASATGVVKVSGSATGTAASAKNTNAAGRLEVGVVAVIVGFAMVL